MDLKQRKLTRTEWNNTEIPVSESELRILSLIIKGFHNVNISYNDTKTLLEFMKIENVDTMMAHLYVKYFEDMVNTLKTTYGLDIDISAKTKKKIRKADIIRIENTDVQLQTASTHIYEFILLNVINNLLKYKAKEENDKWLGYYYSLYYLMQNNVDTLNTFVRQFVDFILELCENDDTIEPTGHKTKKKKKKDKKEKKKEKDHIFELIKNGHDIIERNKYIMKHSDITLYTHQKELFTLCKRPNPKLILYIAPTGTGKTLSPIGLSENYKIIFVCAARHVGLALAKAAISLRKKIAFAFGCNDSDDIRLHYFSAKEFIKDRKSGGIRKVDNTIGDKVEIMITDIKSYLPAMYYMNAFNDPKDIILYWDEPTITLDYETHEFHDVIKKNWAENIIPNVVLSSATLPQKEDIHETIMDFRSKFNDVEIHDIVSHDCKKTIPLINKEGFSDLPHFMFNSYDEILGSVKHCEQYKTLLRYFDLKEIIRFVVYINKRKLYSNKRYSIATYFQDISDVTMISIKLYYLTLLKNIEPEKWPVIYERFQENRKKKYKSNVYITTEDAYTLTDGPTIFLSDDVEKIAKFALQTAKIPDQVLKDIMQIIGFNNKLTDKINVLEKKMEDTISKNAETDKAKEKKMEAEIMKAADEDKTSLLKTIEELRGQIQSVALNDMFVPNRLDHIKHWTNMTSTGSTFTSDIDENTMEKIMLLHEVDDSWKILLLMGIGVFTNHPSIAYTEIMKDLAQQQKLYLIIASTDYIYGTNYQFCHGYISKDLKDMSQEKAIQAMGRVGRNNIQQDYTIRFRDDELLKCLFVRNDDKPEVRNMNRLFNSD